MPRQLKSLAQMNSDGLTYLSENTDITYLAEGGIARGLLEATNLEISRLQEYIASTHRNVFVNSADGFYLDLIGQSLGLPRGGATYASAKAEDRNVKFSVQTGKLGDFFADPGNQNQGLIPKGTTVSTADETIVYKVTENVYFAKTAKEVFVPVLANETGDAYRVGKNRLTVHSGPSSVNVTNLKEISNGDGLESDRQYRFRLSNHLAASPTANELSIKLAVLGNADISRVEMKEFARGAGTFDALMVPVGNTISAGARSNVQASIEQAQAFGINGRAVEPNYVKFKISIQLIPNSDTGAGLLDSARIAARTAALDYFETIPLGGEMIINRMRAAVIDAVGTRVKDIRILDLCINGRPYAIRNFKLKRDELFTPELSNDQPAVLIV